jgi:hypothetical protein
MYKLGKTSPLTNEPICIFKTDSNLSIPLCADNTDFQAFKTAVLDQQPSGAVVEDGDSFSLNTNTDESILKDADGNSMTIEQGKTYVRTLP